MSIAILIPAYKPSEKFSSFIKSLASASRKRIIVVDDGGGDLFSKIFEEVRQIPNVTVLTHDSNKGKGAALKTGLLHAHLDTEIAHGVITADADGQHTVEDILKVAAALEQRPKTLILGARAFAGKVPLRSQFGNQLTKGIFKIFFGLPISDTQTGLRGIHKQHIPLFLEIPYNRYEYETEMLLVTSRNNIPIYEVPIETIYENNNESSHFNPLLDSFKIYYVLFRYTLASLLSALVDFIVFVAVMPFVHNILFATYCARVVSLGVNYGLVSKKVFKSDEKMRRTFPKYLALVIISGATSSLLIYLMNHYTSVPITLGKIIAETILYVVNFYIQKKIIFKKHI